MKTKLVDRNNPASFHYHSVWQERARDTDLALWLRVAALAFANHKRNGHATFASGEVVKMLGKPKSDVYHAIKKAIAKGWISRESKAQCLVVPPHAVTGGGDGNANDRCVVHDGRVRKRDVTQ